MDPFGCRTSIVTLVLGVLLATCGLTACGGSDEGREVPAAGDSAAGREAGGASEVSVIEVSADASLDDSTGAVLASPAGPGGLQRALEGIRGPVVLELAPGRHVVAPSVFVDPTCGNCPDPDEPVEGTLGLRVSGNGIRIRGTHPDSVVIHTNAGYGLFFEGCRDCALEGVTVTGGVRDPDGRATNGGVVARNATVTLSDCRISGNVGDSATVSEVVVGIAGIVGREEGRLTVDGCRIDGNSWDGIALYRGAWGEFRNNVVDGVDQASGARIGGGRGVGIGLTWNAEATVEGNLVRRYWKGIGVFVDARATIRHNIVEEILTWGIAYWAAGDGAAAADIRENVIFRTGACGAMLAGSDAAGPVTGGFVGNALVETAQNPTYDSGEPYCTQVPIAGGPGTADEGEGVPPGFQVAENLLHSNRHPGARAEPPRQLTRTGFREAAAPLVSTLRGFRALAGSTFFEEWGAW